MFLFEELLRGRANRYAHTHYHHSHPHSHPGVHPNAPMEEPYDPDKPRKDREAREAAEARRQRDAAARRAAAERERIQEKEEAERRQKAKAEEKKSKAAAKQEAAEKAARARQQRTQDLRSAVFAAARSRNAEKVRKGVWEDEVDAAGGEVRVGLENFAKTKPKDPKETLLHIAAYNGDVDLVEWLDTHNAEADGRNSNEMTAFHVALQRGHIPIVKYFFETYPVNDSDSDPVYEPPPNRPLLLLAMESAEPEAVWLILDKKLASRKEIKASWEWLWSTTGQRLYTSSKKTGKLDEVKNILMKYGGFTAPPTPPPSSASDHAPEAALDSRSTASVPSTQPEEPQPPTPTPGNKGKGKAKGGRGKRGGHQQQPSQPHIVDPPSSQPESSAGGNSRGGRGRGRGRGRGGRGRGQGRGAPPAQPAQ
ncbi:uncharacterized protein STEHIDRAFT_118931 [Stereum hirsutum FP-91666 SS1]|uniref:uncharacterized protein n=1 Tax=Stereum hirsutum (strain FP-91666) TaxID=721885 RepID=UPI000440A99B|nr:uncharacterized protein STEHIDRAFT_118931 [Stereum hirsutum FP-91666 SS1]EIM89836.1 hypothetical protein STEHIDRAFT_118931 [Stereum hirsutum FP-91666 SS1]